MPRRITSNSMSFLLLLCMASAFQQRTLAESIPQSLRSSVPSCAWSCLSSYIQSNYPAKTCPDQDDVGCLCSHTGAEGFTLQEGAFVCAHQNCAGEATQSSINSTYNICNGQRGALPATHSTLPTTFSAKPTQPSSTSSPLPSMSTTTSVASDASSTASSTTTSSATSSGALSVASPTVSPARGLQTSQIVGITVASGAAVILVISIGIVIICLRRRRQRQHHERLDSGKLSYEEFKPPVVAEKRSVPDLHAMKDPRGGPGGVGVAPIQYKAILPPANLFAQQSAAPAPSIPAAHKRAESDNDLDVTSNSTVDELPPRFYGRQPLGHKPTASVLSGVTSIASSRYSTDQTTDPKHQYQETGYAGAPPPNAFLQGRRFLNLGPKNGVVRDSSASQFTQFEEDGPLQSATIPPGIASRPLYPQLNYSENTTPESEGVSCSSSSDAQSFRKSRGPSLRLDIPSQQLQLPPPPARPPNSESSRAAPPPYVPTAMAGRLPCSNEQRPELQAPATQPLSRAQPLLTVTTGAAPPRFPAPLSGRLVAEGLSSEGRKDSVSRRGFSQPKATAYLNTNRSVPPSRLQNQPLNASELTVNGERINYPTIPTSSASPPKSAPLRSLLPGPPPGPPPRFPMAHAVDSARSSMDDDRSPGGSLLAKRRGSEHAAALEKQLRIQNSHGSSFQKQVGPGPRTMNTPPRSFRDMENGTSNNTHLMPPSAMYSAPVQPPAQSRWNSPPTANARENPSYAQQGDGNQRRAPPNAARYTQDAPQGQYKAYRAPAPQPLKRPGPVPIQPSLISPTPGQMTPARRGDDMYLSIQ